MRKYGGPRDLHLRYLVVLRELGWRLTSITAVAATRSTRRCFFLPMTSIRSIGLSGQPLEVGLITSAGDGLLQPLIELSPQLG